MIFKLAATIPTAQYGNLMPEIKVEADSLEEAEALVLPYIEKMWAKYCEPGRELTTKSALGSKLTAFVGGEINYNDTKHLYINDEGEIYLSGSVYAEKFERPFETQIISEAMAKKSNVSQADIVAMWNLKSQVSRDFGSALHGALQLYGTYRALGESLDKTTHLHDHPMLKTAIEGFFEGREKENAVYEALIVDHKNKRAGQVDRLLITGRKKCRIQDFKTNVSIKKSLTTYWHQLSFYAAIMIAGGWTVEGLDIFNWVGEWTTYTAQPMEVK